uniref:ABC transporter domain-containing protein n=1 Tax=Glossina morsitans morsitans TaxID=37546 RepID=A0ABK9MIZ9_GLOMM
MELKPCLQEQLDVEFQDVCYSVKIFKNYVQTIGKLDILHGVSGRFGHGKLSAIMGSSGAGKSSLLNALSGYVTIGVSGDIICDRKNICYIVQEDEHGENFTVGELMNLACDLRLGRKQRSEKKEIISKILIKLSMNHRVDVKPYKLSGGERKRLSIALELVANPKILFLDEPISGLDEVTARQCIQLLSTLAKEGHTIVCTVHQPSMTIFNYFDSVYVLGKGQCVYQGPPRSLIPFLQHIQRECPMQYSPPDYIIELCDFEGEKIIPLMSEAVGNGKYIYYDDAEIKINNNINGIQKPFRRTIAEQTALEDSRFALRNEEISGFYQFKVLFTFMMLKIVRARISLLLQFVHHSLVGVCMGLLIWNKGNEGALMYEHMKFCVINILMVAYTQIIIPVLGYPTDVKLLKKETFNHWYTLPPYYAAFCLSRVPLQIFLNVMYLGTTYTMYGLPMQWSRFILFVLAVQMTSFVAEGIGLTIASTFNIINGTVVGPVTIATFLGTAIYGFDFVSRIPKIVDILLTFTFMRVGCKALIFTLFGFGREKLNCDDYFCHFSDPRVLLKFLGLHKTSFQEQILLLLIMVIFFRILFYLGLRRRCKT